MIDGGRFTRYLTGSVRIDKTDRNGVSCCPRWSRTSKAIEAMMATSNRVVMDGSLANRSFMAGFLGIGHPQRSGYTFPSLPCLPYSWGGSSNPPFSKKKKQNSIGSCQRHARVVWINKTNGRSSVRIHTGTVKSITWSFQGKRRDSLLVEHFQNHAAASSHAG